MRKRCWCAYQIGHKLIERLLSAQKALERAEGAATNGANLRDFEEPVAVAGIGEEMVVFGPAFFSKRLFSERT